MNAYHLFIKGETSIDISERLMKRVIRQLIKLLEMKPLGNCKIHPGNNILPGFSAIQAIETSHITFHYFSHINELWIDILSCKKFNKREVGDYLTHIFKLK